MGKLLWHSNAPWAPTGYGQQLPSVPLLATQISHPKEYSHGR